MFNTTTARIPLLHTRTITMPTTKSSRTHSIKQVGKVQRKSSTPPLFVLLQDVAVIMPVLCYRLLQIINKLTKDNPQSRWRRSRRYCSYLLSRTNPSSDNCLHRCISFSVLCDAPQAAEGICMPHEYPVLVASWGKFSCKVKICSILLFKNQFFVVHLSPENSSVTL